MKNKDIAHILYSKKYPIENLGLLNGKVGISIFFFHLARYRKDIDCLNQANKLIEEIEEEIVNNSNIDFENGLAGIGVALEYLAQKGFIDADTDDVYNSPQK